MLSYLHLVCTFHRPFCVGAASIIHDHIWVSQFMGATIRWFSLGCPAGAFHLTLTAGFWRVAGDEPQSKCSRVHSQCTGWLLDQLPARYVLPYIWLCLHGRIMASCLHLPDNHIWPVKMLVVRMCGAWHSILAIFCWLTSTCWILVPMFEPQMWMQMFLMLSLLQCVDVVLTLKVMCGVRRSLLDVCSEMVMSPLHLCLDHTVHLLGVVFLWIFSLFVIEFPLGIPHRRIYSCDSTCTCVNLVCEGAVLLLVLHTRSKHHSLRGTNPGCANLSRTVSAVQSQQCRHNLQESCFVLLTS